jgi:glucokinase
MDYKVKHYKKKFNYSKFVLGGDIGGTNTILAIAGVKKKKIDLLFILYFQSQKLRSLIPALNKTLALASEKGIRVSDACIAGAGPVKKNKIKLTNVKWNISKKEILKKTSLKKLKLLNDFEAIGYKLNKKDALIIGAGTGLGVSIVKNKKVIATEKGHAKLDLRDKSDKNLAKALKAKEYEDLLSGRGLEKIYRFLTKKSKKAEEISRQKDSKETFRLFAKYLAKAITKFAKQAKVKAVYITGGIAVKNNQILKKYLRFKDINFYIVRDQNLGLLGACFAASKLTK